MGGFATEWRRRVGPHAAVILGCWPLLTVLAAAIDATALPYCEVTALQGILGAAAGLVVLGVDVAVVGLLALGTSTVAFATLAVLGCLPRAQCRRSCAAEPVVLFLFAVAGAALAYPTVVTHPFLRPLGTAPVAVVIALVVLVAFVAASRLAGGRRALAVAAVPFAIGVALPLPVAWRLVPTRIMPGRAPLVVLGLDSLSHADDLGPLRTLARHEGGTWYAHAVTPGLLTNAVWASVILMQPVERHGVFHGFQSLALPAGTETLVTRAGRAGFRTVAVFPDQITTWVGSQGGFDEDRSGPVGWRALTTSLVADASVLLPLVRPLLPRVLAGAVAQNHAGTYTYDLDRELDAMFAEGDTGGRAFVAAHTTYLHSPRFPSWRELDPGERARVARAPAAAARDRSFDWQDRGHATDALPLRAWKVRRLQAAVVAAIARTRFLAPERGGQLVVFSDHGDRVGLDPNTFWRADYHHVPLVTFGLPARDPETPISLLDVGALVGLAPEAAPHDPSVEFIVTAPRDWVQLMRTAMLRWDGTVDLDPAILQRTFGGLRRHRPWPAEMPARVYLVFAPMPPTS